MITRINSEKTELNRLRESYADYDRVKREYEIREEQYEKRIDQYKAQIMQLELAIDNKLPEDPRTKGRLIEVETELKYLKERIQERETEIFNLKNELKNK